MAVPERARLWGFPCVVAGIAQAESTRGEACPWQGAMSHASRASNGQARISRWAFWRVSIVPTFRHMRVKEQERTGRAMTPLAVPVEATHERGMQFRSAFAAFGPERNERPFRGN